MTRMVTVHIRACMHIYLFTYHTCEHYVEVWVLGVAAGSRVSRGVVESPGSCRCVTAVRQVLVPVLWHLNTLFRRNPQIPEPRLLLTSMYVRTCEVDTFFGSFSFQPRPAKNALYRRPFSVHS